MDEFATEQDQTILGHLAQFQSGNLTTAQRDAWSQQILTLRKGVESLTQGTLCFEYLIPRMGKRVDNILLVGNTVLVIEFKVGSQTYNKNAVHQVVDYALDLKNFHEACRDITIIPILVATHAPDCQPNARLASDGVSSVLLANHQTLASVIRRGITLGKGSIIEPQSWLRAGYRPTPTIIEASQALYRGHSVADISRHEAGCDNLGTTTESICRIIDKVKADHQKAICLVTGVPGAGKTLAGLNLANERRKADLEGGEHAVFLSGNGPLVKVLQEALARDEVERSQVTGVPIRKAEALRKSKAFIQNIHHFRDEYLSNSSAPTERVVVFDEAQRAWNLEQTAKFMQQKRGRPDFPLSEPAFLISVMNRHVGWSVIVCLVGEGQEINTGEAGMEEWISAIEQHYPDWLLHLPDRATTEKHLPHFRLKQLTNRITRLPELHLGISIRSFRTERLAASINALLNLSVNEARENLIYIRNSYEICITRSIENAKKWVRDQARGTERYGLLTSSGARRLKPLGIIAGGVKDNECNWFLDDEHDVRSSYYLEDAASEFEVQGLELDWAIVVWDGDLIFHKDGWIFRSFKGTAWQTIRKPEDQQYRLNAYRVLLTRARQGFVIVIPDGDLSDPTRSPEFYDPTWDYLVSLGLTRLP